MLSDIITKISKLKFLEYATQIQFLENEFDRRVLDIKKFENHFHIIDSLSVNTEIVDNKLQL